MCIKKKNTKQELQKELEKYVDWSKYDDNLHKEDYKTPTYKEDYYDEFYDYCLEYDFEKGYDY